VGGSPELKHHAIAIAFKVGIPFEVWLSDPSFTLTGFVILEGNLAFFSARKRWFAARDDPNPYAEGQATPTRIGQQFGTREWLSSRQRWAQNQCKIRDSPNWRQTHDQRYSIQLLVRALSKLAFPITHYRVRNIRRTHHGDCFCLRSVMSVAGVGLQNFISKSSKQSSERAAGRGRRV